MNEIPFSPFFKCRGYREYWCEGDVSGDIFLFVGIAPPVREYAFRGLPEAGAIKGVFYDQPLWLPVRSNILSLPWHIFL